MIFDKKYSMTIDRFEIQINFFSFYFILTWKLKKSNIEIEYSLGDINQLKVYLFDKNRNILALEIEFFFFLESWKIN